ncbi:hypothetical protein [Robinsoniella sp. KNHs210]|uniref:hypothetical protein n=1 Tax=Robinsoniella sp. KNHs210 TaxID=1469950 RepID=UPI0004828DAB|nr:hypothetical protein [Robinsoniella sp. KNHs210]
MNYKLINTWLVKYDIVLEQSFVEALRQLANKYTGKKLSELYTELGCTKTDISRWESNPCSTHALCKESKKAVIIKAALLFDLDHQQSELLANKAGLSLCQYKEGLAKICENYNENYKVLLQKASVSERMFQYYLKGKVPTKQALLAIAISLDLSFAELDDLLHAYGYNLSKSLPNDAVVLWFLKSNSENTNRKFLLDSINEVLAELELPVLMTKLINR